MEPFGLFQILQSFLNTNANTTANTTGAVQETPSTPTTEDEIKKAPQEEESAPNAFLSFMDAHDKRARRIKKP